MWTVKHKHCEELKKPPQALHALPPQRPVGTLDPGADSSPRAGFVPAALGAPWAPRGASGDGHVDRGATDIKNFVG